MSLLRTRLPDLTAPDFFVCRFLKIRHCTRTAAEEQYSGGDTKCWWWWRHKTDDDDDIKQLT